MAIERLKDLVIWLYFCLSYLAGWYWLLGKPHHNSRREKFWMWWLWQGKKFIASEKDSIVASS